MDLLELIKKPKQPDEWKTLIKAHGKKIGLTKTRFRRIKNVYHSMMRKYYIWETSGDLYAYNGDESRAMRMHVRCLEKLNKHRRIMSLREKEVIMSYPWP